MLGVRGADVDGVDLVSPRCAKPKSSTPMKVKPKCWEYGCSMRIGGNGASLIVWQESTAKGLKSISDFESVLTSRGSTLRSISASLSMLDLVTIGSGTLIVEVALIVELALMGAISAIWMLSRSLSM